MKLDVFKAVLAESKAEFVEANVWTLSDRDNSFVRRWQIDRSQAQAAEAFLRTYTSAQNFPNAYRSITNPVASTLRPGVFRGGRVMAKLEKDPQSGDAELWYVYQELREGLQTTTLDADGQVDFSMWHKAEGESFRTDANQVILQLPNVDPAFEDALAGELTADSYTAIQLADERLVGLWHNIKVTSKVDDDGSYTLLLFLSKHNNRDLYFHYQADAVTHRGHFYKWETTEELIQQFLSERLFAADGTLLPE